MVPGRKSKHFFFEKKKQKTFSNCRVFPEKYTAENKSFLVLFFKKEHSSCACLSYCHSFA